MSTKSHIVCKNGLEIYHDCNEEKIYIWARGVDEAISLTRKEALELAKEILYREKHNSLWDDK